MRRNPAAIGPEEIERFGQLLSGYDAPDPQHVRPTVSVKISGHSVTIGEGTVALGGGKYVGKMVQNEVAPTGTDWLTSNLTLDDNAYHSLDDCYVIHWAEAGTTGHALAADAVVECHVVGVAPDGRYIVAVAGGAGASDSVGEYKGQVHMMVSDVAAGWDWPKFIPYTPE